MKKKIIIALFIACLCSIMLGCLYLTNESFRMRIDLLPYGYFNPQIATYDDPLFNKVELHTFAHAIVFHKGKYVGYFGRQMFHQNNATDDSYSSELTHNELTHIYIILGAYACIIVGALGIIFILFDLYLVKMANLTAKQPDTASNTD